MAILNYAELFARLEPLVYWFYELESRQTDTASTGAPIPYIKNEILAPFVTQGTTEEIPNLETVFNTLVKDHDKAKEQIIKWAEAILASYATTLGVSSKRAADIIDKLYLAMEADTTFVTDRVVSIDTADVLSTMKIVPATSNTGSGSLLYTVQDAYYTGLVGATDTNIAIAEVMHVQCIDASTEGSEIFSLSGAPAAPNAFSYLSRGSGRGPNITALGNTITNGNFEDWTGAAPDNWTISSGAFGTDIIKETTASKVFRGSYSIKIPARTLGSTFLRSTIHTTTLPINTWIFFAVAGFQDAIDADGVFTIKMYDGVTDEELINFGDVTVATELNHLVWDQTFKLGLTPSRSVNSWYLEIEFMNETRAIYIDNIQCGKATVHNNISFAILAGATRFVVGDRFGYAAASGHTGFAVEATSGVWQDFFGRCWKKQLPGDTPGTIAEPAE